MVTIYRIENATGIGPYQDGGAFCWMTHMPEGHANQFCPTPNQDPGLKYVWESLPYTVQRQHTFGFTSLEQLRRWFVPEVLQALHENKYYIQVYEVPEVTESDFQAIFVHAYATKKYALSCVELEFELRRAA